MTGRLVARDHTAGTVVAASVESAASFFSRLIGLMGRTSLPTGSGLWIPGANGIHMLFMRFPIDTVFLSHPDGDGRCRVVGIRRSLAPWRGVVWFVRGAHGALELPVGAIDAARVELGHMVELRQVG